ncbi:hypothetical protein PoB_000041000 [Plakobranchus ocellatus]|uniref:Secreted protein n=1 Tax=Plakobranchus ocellatus TaxID=259542 RepID=A0AAV3XSM9_9GAST|nr:hypothetical protein PoB_000041000 [Plakobranchus ocellatus]
MFWLSLTSWTVHTTFTHTHSLESREPQQFSLMATSIHHNAPHCNINSLDTSWLPAQTLTISWLIVTAHPCIQVFIAKHKSKTKDKNQSTDSFRSSNDKIANDDSKTKQNKTNKTEEGARSSRAT